MGEAEDSGVLAVTYRMKIKDMVESEFIECISANAMDSLYQEIQARKEAETRAKQEEEEAARQAALLEQSSIEHCQMQTRPRAKMMRPENLRTPEAEGLGPDPGGAGREPDSPAQPVSCTETRP